MSIVLGKTLKRLREKEGIYQADLAEAIGVSKSTIGFWEINRCEPSLDMLQAVADYFNVTPNYLLGYDNIIPGEKLSNIEQQALSELRQLDEPEQYRSISYMQALRENKQANERIKKS